jgi:acetyl esterase/lipase
MKMDEMIYTPTPDIYFRQLLLSSARLGRATVKTLVRRLRSGPAHENWPLSFEIMVEMLDEGTRSHAERGLRDMRASFELSGRIRQPLSSRIEPTTAGGVPAFWVIPPDADPERVVLYLHGGGYVSGSPQTYRGLADQIAVACGAHLLLIDYRLAPEHPFPAALEDAWKAYWRLLSRGFDPAHIVVGGDSAGGGLTMALLLALRDAHAPLPAAAFGLSPWVDLTHSGGSIYANANIDYLNLPGMEEVAGMYLAGHDPRDPLASPAYGDLHGLPPLLIQAGTAEMLFDGAQRFARRAAEAGVPVTFEPWENMVHVWQAFYKMLPEAREAIEHIGRFVREETGIERGFG